MNDFVVQTMVSEELASALKVYSALRKVNLTEVFNQAIQEFIRYWQLMHKNGESVAYLTSPKGSKPFNIRIPEDLARRLQPLADEDSVSVRRLGYTALVHFAVGQNLIAPIGTIRSGVTKADVPNIAAIMRAVRKSAKTKRRA